MGTEKNTMLFLGVRRSLGILNVSSFNSRLQKTKQINPTLLPSPELMTPPIDQCDDGRFHLSFAKSQDCAPWASCELRSRDGGRYRFSKHALSNLRDSWIKWSFQDLQTRRWQWYTLRNRDNATLLHEKLTLAIPQSYVKDVQLHTTRQRNGSNK